MEYCYVLDYANCELHEIELADELEEKYNEDARTLIADIGLNADECSWMFSDSPLNVHRYRYSDIIPHNGHFERIC